MDFQFSFSGALSPIRLDQERCRYLCIIKEQETKIGEMLCAIKHHFLAFPLLFLYTFVTIIVIRFGAICVIFVLYMELSLLFVQTINFLRMCRLYRASA